MQTELEKNNKWQWIALVATSVIVIAAIYYAWRLSRELPDISFQNKACGFSTKLHLYCPGCGGTRSLKSYLQGDFIASVLANPIPVYTTILVARIWIALFHNTVLRRLRKHPAADWRVMYQWEMWMILVVVIGFFVLRNLALVFLHWDYLGNLRDFWI